MKPALILMYVWLSDPFPFLFSSLLSWCWQCVVAACQQLTWLQAFDWQLNSPVCGEAMICRHPVSLGLLLLCDSWSFIPCLSRQTCCLPCQAVRSQSDCEDGQMKWCPAICNWVQLGLNGHHVGLLGDETKGLIDCWLQLPCIALFLEVLINAQDDSNNLPGDAASWRWVRRSCLQRNDVCAVFN